MEVATSGVHVLPYTASSVGAARRRLIGDLKDAGVVQSPVDDASLVLSELISNALRHATPLSDGTAPGGTVKVSWDLDSESVVVAVSDGGGQSVPRVHESTGSSLGGRGLGIVARLSRRWGVRTGDGGETTVWAQLPVQYADVPALVIASSRDA
jgi:anti-sigma regulatory factor (Ser/Thr protein kinase)